MLKWRIEREWAGETCAILASGPSMTQEVADTVRDRCKVIAVSDSYRLAPWADILYSADRDWWLAHEGALNFAGRKVSIETLPNIGLELEGIHYLENGGYGMLDPRPTHIRTGKNSGYQALHIAVHLGVKRILLCGFNMRPIDGKNHWFGDHPAGLQKTMPYEVWVARFREIAPLLKFAEIEVINCTPHSALHCFTEQSLEKALGSVLSDKRHAALSA